MQISRISKLMGGLTVLATLALALALLQRPDRNETTAAMPQVTPRTAPNRQSKLPPARQSAESAGESAAPEQALEPPAVDYDWRRMLQDGKLPPRLPREVVEAFLQKRQRSAESLLAAYHALDDTNLLAEAASRFPNDPRVLKTVLSHNLYPEERRKWLEMFKASAPDNAVANYLSAQEHLNNRYQEETGGWVFGADRLPLQEYLKTGQAQAAINELVEAAGKPLFRDYTLEARLDEEELNLAAGRSVIQSRLGASGWNSDLMPELTQFKSIAVSLQQLEKSYLASGDTESAQNLARLGLSLANRLRSGESGQLVINQLVGTASEAIHLNAWDANTSYDFLGGRTPGERLAEMKQERAALRTLTRSVEEQLPTMAEADLLSYSDRQRLFGEAEAMRWLQQRTQTSAAPSP